MNRLELEGGPTSIWSPAASSPRIRDLDDHSTAAVDNEVLAALRPDDLSAIFPLLIPTVYAPGQILQRAGERIRDVHFVGGGLVRLSIPLSGGRFAPAGVIGREGVVGLAAALDKAPAVDNASVIVGGRGYRLPAADIVSVVEARATIGAALVQRLARQVVELQVEFACCAQHGVEQRLARLLLTASARLGCDSLTVTQEELASMLGVQRTTVSTIAGQLKRSGALAYLRATVRIADAEQLANFACDCGRELWEEAPAMPDRRLAR